MKTGLQRIETTLNQLQPNSDGVKGTPQSTTAPALSFRVKDPYHQNNSATPALPKFKSVSFTNHRNAANPALATNLLQEIDVIVSKWQKELRQVVRQIQDLYLEGPIIDGWLESPVRQPQAQQNQVSKAKQDHLLDYIDEVTHEKVAYQSPRPGYRLCGLDENGKLWSKPCPVEQVPEVSVAIARYQKLRQLLNRKQDREYRLNQVSETLVLMHSTLSTDSSPLNV